MARMKLLFECAFIAISLRGPPATSTSWHDFRANAFHLRFPNCDSLSVFDSIFFSCTSPVHLSHLFNPCTRSARLGTLFCTQANTPQPSIMKAFVVIIFTLAAIVFSASFKGPDLEAINNAIPKMLPRAAGYDCTLCQPRLDMCMKVRVHGANSPTALIRTVRYC